MRIIILSHPRSGGLNLLNFIQMELNYNMYHEPFSNLSDDELNLEVLVNENIVVKEFPSNIIKKGYDFYDVISKFEKIIIHHRDNKIDIAISKLYFQGVPNEIKKNMHHPYKISDEWILNNQEKIKDLVDGDKDLDLIKNLLIKNSLSTSYDGIYENKSDILKLLTYINVYNPIYLDMLDKRHRLRNGDVGMNDIKVKQKLI